MGRAGWLRGDRRGEPAQIGVEPARHDVGVGRGALGEIEGEECGGVPGPVLPLELLGPRDGGWRDVSGPEAGEVAPLLVVAATGINPAGASPASRP